LIAKIGEQHRRGRGDEQGAPIGVIGGKAAKIATVIRTMDQEALHFPPAKKFSQGGKSGNFEGG
jgi:hypothetical protein